VANTYLRVEGGEICMAPETIPVKHRTCREYIYRRGG
jgi:hypothetical protein